MVFHHRLFRLFSHDIGVDLGTCNTIVYVRGKGIVLNEPSVVAVHKGTNDVLLGGQAVGITAKRMLGRVPHKIEAIRPLKDGVIANFQVTEAMLTYFIRKVHNYSSWVRPRVVVAVPSGITEVERRAVVNSAERAGASKVYIVEEPIAAAIGVGLPIDEPVGNMIVDIGGGTTEVAVISYMGMVYCKSLRIAGDEMDEAIADYLKSQYNLIIGETTAENIKIQIGSAAPLEEELTMEVMGRDQVKGLPRAVTIRSEEIREALKEPLDAIVGAVLETLEHTPPELAADIYTRGIALAGGGALMRGIDRLITKETRGIPVRVADEPLLAVARGTGVFLEDLETFADAFEDRSET
ncbi:MAG: rod shape-determining protein [Planctomycetota bacterium]|nr:rod shape-determining protein [Planctomycetota bacterium]